MKGLVEFSVTHTGWQQFYSGAIWTEGVIFSKNFQNFKKILKKSVTNKAFK